MTATPGQADPWQVITDVTSELLRGGQTADIRCRAALGVLKRAGIDFNGNPVATAAQEPHAAPGGSSPPGLRHAVTSNRLGHALAALREIRDDTDGDAGDGDLMDRARQALDDDAAIRGNVALTQEPQPAPGLREALEATLSDWRGDAEYRPTDTRDEITEHHAVSVCADTLAGILADHPDAEPRPAPKLADAKPGLLAEILGSFVSFGRHGQFRRSVLSDDEYRSWCRRAEVPDA